LGLRPARRPQGLQDAPQRGGGEDLAAGQLVAIRRGEVAAAKTALTVEDIVNAWLDGARKGTVRTRSQSRSAGGTIRSVEQNYRLRVKDRCGRRRIERLTLLELQEWVDELDGDGVHPGTIETSVLPLRMAYRRAKTRGGRSRSIRPTDSSCRRSRSAARPGGRPTRA